ncbi:hypothetical protein GVAV_002296 [Gurleya vavrai]
MPELFYLEHEFLEEFLQNKFLLSNNEKEFSLYWKFLLLKDKVSEAADNLIEIAQKKFLSFDLRKEYLKKSYCIEKNDETRKLKEIALIQEELANKENDLYLKSYLIDPNELFNIFLYPKHPFLALKLLKLTESNDEKLIEELFEILLDGDFYFIAEKLGFVQSLNNDRWVKIDIIGDLLIKKLLRNNQLNIVDVLLNFNYNEIEIHKFLEERLKGDLFTHPETKRRILSEIKDYFKEKKNIEEIEKFCYENYGIQIN